MVNKCMFMAPSLLTGDVDVCLLCKNLCNHQGKDCVGYKKHTALSRKALAEEIRNRQRIN